MKDGIVPGIVLAGLVALAGVYVFVLHREDAPTPPPVTSVVTPEGTFLKVTPSLSVKVQDDIPENPQLLCSKCYKPFPRNDGYVIPTYNERLKSYVGTYLCENDVKAAVGAARVRYAAHDSEEELGGFSRSCVVVG